MAETDLVLFTVVENFLLNGENDVTFLALSDGLKRASLCIAFFMKRDHVPRITGYTENVIPQFSADDFRYHFRVSVTMYEEILRAVGIDLSKQHGGGTEETHPSKQLLIFLGYMANQESMREISLYFGIGLATTHGVIRRVSKAIIKNLMKVIQWPDDNEQQAISREFQLQTGLPDVVGALDGTHIRLSSCPKGDNDYINRKSYPSIQLQVVVDNKLMIRDVYTGWPGCTHDARVLRNLSLYRHADEGNHFPNGRYIFGDSAYPLKNWLITPFKDNGHLNADQKRFNRILSSGRQVVERGIGHLKGRFRRLREVTVHSVEDIVDTVVSGTILHNLCLIHSDSLEDFIEPVDDDAHPNGYQNIFANAPNGIDKRRQLMDRLL